MSYTTTGNNDHTQDLLDCFQRLEIAQNRNLDAHVKAYLDNELNNALNSFGSLTLETSPNIKTGEPHVVENTAAHESRGDYNLDQLALLEKFADLLFIRISIVETSAESGRPSDPQVDQEFQNARHNLVLWWRAIAADLIEDGVELCRVRDQVKAGFESILAAFDKLHCVDVVREWRYVLLGETQDIPLLSTEM